jgi:hypothetical protein
VPATGGAAIVARAAEAGDYQPRLIVSGDGGSSRPAVVSSAAPLAPKTESSDFMPRLLVAAGGDLPAVRPLSSGPLTAPTSSAGDFMPRLVTGGSAPSARPPRPVPPVEAAPAGDGAVETPQAAADANTPVTDKTDPV